MKKRFFDTRRVKRAAAGVGFSMAGASMLATMYFYPWAVDPEEERNSGAASDYYAQAFASAPGAGGQSGGPPPAPLTDQETRYVELSRRAARENRIPERVRGFVEKYNLQHGKVLEVGAGSGLLQDVVQNYVALDISPSAARFFHKPFVRASATAMPFPDSSFDAAWSIWVLEHIPNPERALAEMRRVVRPGGYLLLRPAFDVDRFLAQGYAVRPYSDFDMKGRLIKASVPIARSAAVHYLGYHQAQLLRGVGARFGPGPSHLHFIQLMPNYETYWCPDSDATTSVSAYELYLWFATRGDRCLNCTSELYMLLHDVNTELIIQLNKQAKTHRL